MTTTRVALVTGGNRGIGLEIARQLARLGVLAVIGARNVDEGEQGAEVLRSEGIDVPVVRFNADDDDAGDAAISDVVRLYDRCDVIVNNAAILIDAPGGFRASLFDLTSDVLRKTFETNLHGPIRLFQAAVPVMRQHGYGRVVNVSSMAGQMAGMAAGYPAYRMSKVALNAFTRIAAAELGEGDFKVNACCPGWVRTDMGGAKAARSPAEGADTPVWLATLGSDGPTGGFFQDRKPLAW